MEKNNLMYIAGFVILTLFLVGIVRLMTPSTYTLNQASDLTLSASGKSQMVVTPDQAVIHIGYKVTLPTAKEAQEALSPVMSKISSYLKESGISKEQIKTYIYSVYPEYVWTNDTYIIKGYTADHVLEVKIYDLDKVGTIIDEVSKLGANKIEGLSFGLKDETREKYSKQLLEMASKDAKEKAESIAKGLNIQIKGIKSVSPVSTYTPYYDYNLRYVGESLNTMETTNIEAGTLTLNEEVNVVFLI